MEIDQINGFKGKKGKNGKGKSKGPPIKGKGRARMAKARNIKSRSGVKAKISRQAISQVNITRNISSIQERQKIRAKDPDHNIKAKAKARASHQSLAGTVAEQ
eukprot:1073093-Amphidinium_carterae.2